MLWRISNGSKIIEFADIVHDISNKSLKEFKLWEWCLYSAVNEIFTNSSKKYSIAVYQLNKGILEKKLIPHILD